MRKGYKNKTLCKPKPLIRRIRQPVYRRVRDGSGRWSACWRFGNFGRRVAHI